MNQHLQSILNFIQQSEHLSDEEKAALLKSAKDADKELEITSFKLDRTEKVKRTTAILLEETIEELEQKRKAVEAQNRELEIEAGLERVRTVALSMNKPDDMLDVCCIISEQLELLHVKEIRNVQTAIFYTEKGTYMNYEYYAKHNKTFITETSYTNHEIHRAFANQMLKGKGEFYATHISKTELLDWIAYQKTTNVFIDSYLETASSLNYHWFSLGPVALGISTYEPLKEEETDLFKRFLKVFELSYTRYSDIEQAIAQAREAQIQLALERVRARTMAMQHSDELPGAANILFQQMQTLDMPAWSAGYCIWDDDHQAITLWMSSAGIIQKPFRTPVTNDPSFMHFYNAWKRGETFYIEEIGGNAIISHYQYMFQLPVVGEMLKQFIADGGSLPTFQIFHLAFFSQGFLLFITYEPVPEAHDIFKRFGKVFEQTYTRFLDLQKAEAQARESQIQLALERVRARTMAMQKSDELSETAYVLFQQFTELGEAPDQITIGNINEEERVIELWLTMQGNQMNRSIKASIDEPIVMHKMFAAWKEQKKSLVIDLAGQELHDYINYRNNLSESGNLPVVKNYSDERRVINVAFFSKGLITFSTPEPKPDETIQLLERFAGVFDLTYTRFLDLKKAEAQTREAQIEAALEKVRSRSLAMHKSGEIKDVVVTVMDKMNELNIEMNGGVSLVTFIEGSQDLLHWYVNPGHIDEPVTMHLSYFNNVVFNDFVEARKAEKEILPVVYSFEEKDKYFKYAFEHSDFKIAPQDLKKWIFEQPYFGYSVAIQKHSAIFFNDYTGKYFSKETNDILIRFSKVFEQAYTRFLDLQKAEVQSRENQIQLALERARAQSMMMQHSKELDETLRVFHEQVLQLNIPSAFSFLWLPDEEKDRHIFWAAWAENNSTVFKSKAINYPLDRNEPATAQCLVDWKSNQPVVSYHVPPEGVENYFAAWSELITGVEQLKPEYFSDGLYYVEAFMKYGCFGVMVKNPLAEDEKKILERFATEFERAYTRFLDLQKAEAQTQEAQIELGLERVRARAMAMQTSEELNALIGIVFTELTKLDLVLTRCVIIIYDAETKGAQWWMANSEAPSAPMNFFVKYADLSFFNVYLKGWEERDLKWQYILEGENKIVTDNFLFKKTELKTLPDFVIEGMKAPHKVYLNASFNNFGNLTLATLEPLSEKHFDILLRFAKVFDLTYTRFNDLQKAEAQAREARIEAALEKVRASAMAMHSSQELQDVVKELRKQIGWLGQNELDTCVIQLYDESPDYVHSYASMTPSDNKEEAREFYRLTPKKGLRIIEEALQAYSSGKKDYVLVNEKKKSKQWMNFFKETYPDIYAVAVETLGPKPEEVPAYWSFSDFNGGTLLMVTLVPAASDSRVLLRRFADVFGLAYRRFVDLKKAEAQAREAQIETTLERVRSRSMGMQKSEELKEVIQIVYKQFVHLNINVEHTGFIMDYKENDDMHIWLADEHAVPFEINIPYFDSPHWNSFKEAKEKGTDFFINTLNFEEKNKFYQDLFKLFPVPDEAKEYYFSCPGLAISTVLLDNIGLYIENFSGTPYSDEDNKTLVRFGKVFQQTYTRFNDLKQAEAQAREATIEAALEKVRGKAMAMHNSTDLSSTASVVFTELRRLGINPIRCGVGILNKESRKAQLYSATSSADGDSLALIGWVELSGHPVLKKIYDTWMKNEEYFPELAGRQLKSYYELLLKGLSVKVPEWQSGQKQYGTFLPFSIGCLYAWSEVPYNEVKIKILKRFSNIIDLTFRRYLELQKSEANAREAVKQAAVDRIRADIASMRTIGDLDRITPLIWNELTILGINFIRCGVFIMDDSQQLIHTFLSTPDGKAIAAFHLPYTTPGNIQKVIGHWHDNKNYIDHWDESDFTQFAEMLVQQKALSSAEEYLKTIPHEGFHLHFLPFLQGMLYVGNTAQLNDDEIKLIQSVADAFSTAYARYEDFNKLEAANAKIEKTLVDLKQAQTQLVQSEKMASLGELTAGIAHEIQNPLNFVNNFSEVNQEMIDEATEEIDKGNIEEVKIILNDIKNNEEKINHHGKRADAIVKGMLQHSRKSEGKKEPTDINALCDEYLRLSYHGLRAKDKEFNTDFKTDFDESIGKINIVPQDVGRVLLNLFNNAFYAVSEKQKTADENYKPLITLATKSSLSTRGEGWGEVEIRVSDNGNGIPQNIIDKIFQPFFTTKPTGQGTGLGLSLSYDIIKAHSGEIKVETKEGEATIFIISLPA